MILSQLFDDASVEDGMSKSKRFTRRQLLAASSNAVISSAVLSGGRRSVATEGPLSDHVLSGQAEHVISIWLGGGMGSLAWLAWLASSAGW